MIQFLKVEYEAVQALREQYLDSIYESQELYLEWMVRGADYYVIRDKQVIGYFIVTPDHILIEFYLIGTKIPNCEKIFGQVVKDLDIGKAYCKSFDPLLLKCCLSLAETLKISGTLFRNFYETSCPVPADFTVRPATQTDFPFLLQQKGDLYESREELTALINGQNIRLYFIGNNLIGCGFLIRVRDNRDFYDIGMWVNPDFRRKGYATAIIADLKALCLDKGWIPICGCASENTGSRRTLEKNGFISRHSLIEFDLKNQ